MPTNTNSELNQWIELLHSSDESDRLVAVKTLQHLGDEDALEPLITALKDESIAVQKLAVIALWELANPAAVPALIPCLASLDEEVRDEARSALGELVSSDHLLLLLDALHQENVDLQLSVLFLLRKIHDVQCLPYILPFFESDQAELREAAVTTLRYLNQVKQCAQAIALLSDSSETVRRSAALTLGHLADTDVVSALCRSLIEDADWQVRRNAAKSLALHADRSAVPALETASSDEHWQVRKFALQALQKTPDDCTLPTLIQALTDEYSDVRRDAAIALGTLKNPVALNALQQALDDPDRDVCIYTQRAIQSIQESLQEPSNA